MDEKESVAIKFHNEHKYTCACHSAILEFIAANVLLRAEVAAWTETAERHARNENFYRDLLDQVASHLGPEVYVADDGSVMDSPLRLKIPELIAALKEGANKNTAAEITEQTRLINERDAARAEVAELKRDIEVLTDYDTETLIFMKDNEITDLKHQLAEAKQLRRDDPNERLHRLCDLLSEQAGESPFTKAEWDRIDQKNSELKHQLAEIERKALHESLEGTRCANCHNPGHEITIMRLESDLTEARHWLESREAELKSVQDRLTKAYEHLSLAREENLNLRQREAKA